MRGGMRYSVPLPKALVTTATLDKPAVNGKRYVFCAFMPGTGIAPERQFIGIMRTKAVISCFAILLIVGCADDNRIVRVETSDRIPVRNATVTIVPGIEGEASSSDVTDASGIARFGTGDWREVNDNISIKIVQDGAVHFDAIRTGVVGNEIRLRCENVPQ